MQLVVGIFHRLYLTQASHDSVLSVYVGPAEIHPLTDPFPQLLHSGLVFRESPKHHCNMICRRGVLYVKTQFVLPSQHDVSVAC